MGRLTTVSIVLFSMLSMQHADAEMREFKLPDGRSLKAEIVDVNAKLGLVELKREDGKSVKVKPDTFVAADQEYIKDWASMDGFRNPALFSINCKDETVEKWRKDEDGNVTYPDGSKGKESLSTSKFQRHVYEIDLENRNGVALENLKFEYRIFYEQDHHDNKRKAVMEEKVVPGNFELDRLLPGSKSTMKTSPVVLEEKEFISGDVIYRGGEPEKVRGEIKGIWLKVSTKTATGLSSVRDVYEPAAIEGKYKWPEHVAPESPKKKGRNKD